jgi:hypothetical protein
MRWVQSKTWLPCVLSKFLPLDILSLPQLHTTPTALCSQLSETLAQTCIAIQALSSMITVRKIPSLLELTRIMSSASVCWFISWSVVVRLPPVRVAVIISVSRLVRWVERWIGWICSVSGWTSGVRVNVIDNMGIDTYLPDKTHNCLWWQVWWHCHSLQWDVTNDIVNPCTRETRMKLTIYDQFTLA